MSTEDKNADLIGYEFPIDDHYARVTGSWSLNDQYVECAIGSSPFPSLIRVAGQVRRHRELAQIAFGTTGRTIDPKPSS